MKGPKREARVLLLCLLMVVRPVQRPTAFAGSRPSRALADAGGGRGVPERRDGQTTLALYSQFPIDSIGIRENTSHACERPIRARRVASYSRLGHKHDDREWRIARHANSSGEALP